MLVVAMWFLEEYHYQQTSSLGLSKLVSSRKSVSKNVASAGRSLSTAKTPSVSSILSKSSKPSRALKISNAKSSTASPKANGSTALSHPKGDSYAA